MALPRSLTLTLIPVALVAAALLGAGLTPATCAQPLQRPSSARTPPQVGGEPLDINTATPAQLNALPGFGPVYTRRVIAGRPYSSKNQLFTRGIIPEGAYERIAALIVAHRRPR